MGPIGLESLLEYFIFLSFLVGGPPKPPQGEITTHEFSHHEISKPQISKSYKHPWVEVS